MQRNTVNGFRNVQAEMVRSVFAKTFKVLHRVSPSFAAGAATGIFLKPRNRKLLPEEKAVRELGSKLRMHIGDKTVRGRRWGSGPAVLLVHGWGGRSTQFRGIVSELISRGFSVVAFDFPGHGESDGRRTNLPECISVVEKAGSLYGPFESVIAHSFGSLCVASVAHEKEIAKKMTLISPLKGARFAVERFGSLTGIPLAVLEKMQLGLERRFAISFEDYDMSVFQGGALPPTLVVHDRQDLTVPFEATAGWIKSADGFEFLRTEGLGHKRILSDPSVIERISDFIGMPRGDIRTQLFSEFAL